MHNKFKETVLKHNLFTENEKIILAVSGGSDSVCMLLLAMKFFGDKYKDHIICAHFNHMIRGEESNRDEIFVRNICEKYNIPCIVGSKDIPAIAKKEKIGLEECARKERYFFLNDISKENGNIKIAVAHNKNDNVETIIGNIARGTSINGLKGILYKKDNIVRPLLDYDKSEINNICNEYSVSAVYDSSNSDNKYKRNNIRNNVIPFLKENLTDQIEEKILLLSESSIIDNSFLEQETDKSFDQCCCIEKYISVNGNSCEKIVFDRNLFSDLHTAIRIRLIRKAVSKINVNEKYYFPDCVDLERKTVLRIEDAIVNGATGNIYDVQKSVYLKISYDYAILYTENELQAVSNSCLLSEIINKKDFIKFNVKNIDKNTEYFDYDKITELFGSEYGIIYRCIESGDVFHPFGAPGSKKLRKYFIDKKIPEKERQIIKSVCINKNVLWIPRLQRRSDIAKIDENTKMILVLKINDIGGC